MGRVIGDGGTAFQIVDIAVDKSHQGLGYGRKIMEEIMTYIDSVAEKGTYVSLMADYPADQLYEKFGFKSTEPYSKECTSNIKLKAREWVSDPLARFSYLYLSIEINDNTSSIFMINDFINSIRNILE